MNLCETALQVRKDVIMTAYTNKAGHIASSLSAVEILTALYFDHVLRYRAGEPDWEGRDRFVLSKGHAALAYYFILAEAGYFDKKELETFCIAGTKYGGEPLRNKIPGVEASTGSLGHGLSYACGIAKYADVFHKDFQVYVLLGDGECQEGEIWEAALFAAQHKLERLTVIIDNNKLQATDSTENIICLNSLKDKWESFGFEAEEIDGHDMEQVRSSLLKRGKGKPKAVIANTRKGKGISFIEGKADWHYKTLTEEQFRLALDELSKAERELLEL